MYARIAGAVLSLILVGGVVMSASQEISAEALAVADSTQYYIIREYKGKVAMFREGEAEPHTVFDVSIEQFTDADADLLRKGIRVNGVRDLIGIIEDLELE